VEAERRRLGTMTAGELRQRYQEIACDETGSRDREELIRRIPRMQTVSNGGI
jgi:hypothetical protein